jgi:hypothetical protein
MRRFCIVFAASARFNAARGAEIALEILHPTTLSLRNKHFDYPDSLSQVIKHPPHWAFEALDFYQYLAYILQLSEGIEL